MPAPYALDRISRLRLQIFGFKLLLPLPVLVAFTSQRNLPLLGALSSFSFWNGVCAGSAAALQHHSLNAAFLTGWDEMTMFFGLSVLIRLVMQSSGRKPTKL